MKDGPFLFDQWSWTMPTFEMWDEEVVKDVYDTVLRGIWDPLQGSIQDLKVGNKGHINLCPILACFYVTTDNVFLELLMPTF